MEVQHPMKAFILYVEHLYMEQLSNYTMKYYYNLKSFFFLS